MGRLRATAHKSAAEIAREWDALAVRRHSQIESGQDLSFHEVLAPLMLDLLRECDKKCVLDIGCGTGELTALVAAHSEHVVALDLSAKSVDVARTTLREWDVDLRVGSLESLAPSLANKTVSCAMAGMTLMTVPDLEAFVRALGSLLARGQHFAATMAHPWFWPRYWSYDEEEWFRYSEEIFIEGPFRITAEETEITTTHVHRPLESYLHEFERAGFLLESLREPMPVAGAIRSAQPAWRFPRFLGLRWVKAV